MPNTAGKDTTPQPGGVRLGGVRADFVAALGKRLVELRQHWDTLVDAPGSPGLRNEFRRHVHALATRARVLRFEAMAKRLELAERKLERAAAAGGIDAEDIEAFDALFRDLPTLAWAEVGDEPPKSEPNSVAGAAPSPPSATPSPSPPPPPSPSSPATPVSVFVIGRAPLANTLSHDPSEHDGLAIEVDASDRLDNALELTRALAPDVVVLDGDLPGAPIVSETLTKDTITESTPIIVVGSFSHADQASDFLAHGVVRALPKPISPRKLRDAIRLTLESQDRYEPAPHFGEVSVEQLADALAQQVRNGLTDALRPEARGVSVDLGQGTEVLAAVWGAVARVREMLTVQSHGSIRFFNTGPVGAMPVAPWLDVKEPDPARRNGRRESDQNAELSLEGQRVLVVDDDPAITWFLSGLFQSHGCAVKEAHDGERGLELAFRFDPDLVVTDILMPKLDGFGLCRALKRDIMLRDVPVIVLSWKEDLLQRVRELGVGADGYLRKEATSSAILRTVHESLRPRSRIEARLREGGEVRGRLDGLTARTLLNLVARTLPDARVSVRDASHLYEVQLRDGHICDASRTALDGNVVAGDEALLSLVRVFTGRFQVVAESGPTGEPSGRSLREIVAPAVAEARAAQSLLEGASLSHVRSIGLRLPLLDLDTLPKPAAETYCAMASGQSPASLVREGVTTAASLEQLLSDAATRGAIETVLDEEGHDLLGPALEAPLHAWIHPLGRGTTTSRQAPPQSKPSEGSEQVEADSQGFAEENPEEDVPEPVPSTDSAEKAINELASMAELDAPPAHIESESAEQPAAPAASAEVFSAPTSLTEAVIREVADASGSEIPPAGVSPSMLDASELRPRSTRRADGVSLPSLPPDAIVPGTESLVPDQGGLDEPAEPSIPDVPSMPPPPDVASLTVGGSEEQQDDLRRTEQRGLAEPKDTPTAQDDATVEDGAAFDDEDDSPVEDRSALDEDRSALDEESATDEDDSALDDEDDSALDDEDDSALDDEDDSALDDEDDSALDDEDDSALDDEDDSALDDEDDSALDDEDENDGEQEIPKRSYLMPLVGVVAVGGALIGAAIYLNPADPHDTAAQGSASATVANSIPAIPTPPRHDDSASPASTQSANPDDSTKRTGGRVETGLPIEGPGKVPADQGLLEVQTGQDGATVSVDGRDLGQGEVIRMFLSPGEHQVMVVWRGKQLRGRVDITKGKRTRLSLEDAWEP